MQKNQARRFATLAVAAFAGVTAWVSAAAAYTLHF